jgi:hypothetical protein
MRFLQFVNSFLTHITAWTSRLEARANGRPISRRLEVRIRNFTPHTVMLRLGCADCGFDATEECTGLAGHGWLTVALPSEGSARCEVSRQRVGMVHVPAAGDIPLVHTVFGPVQGLPDPEPGVLLVVSRIVAEALPNRHDLVIPDDIVRDENGNVINARALATLAR